MVRAWRSARLASEIGSEEIAVDHEGVRRVAAGAPIRDDRVRELLDDELEGGRRHRHAELARPGLDLVLVHEPLVARLADALVLIVATEEALSAVPRSMREGSLACGASKWQTIWRIVLPRAAPGIMTGLILAMARGAGEVAPLMIVGVVKLAPDLPIDLSAPFVHLERSFMHLGFHIYDVGFQSRNSEAGRPMVFVTTLLLITLVLTLNAFAIFVRNRLKKSYQVGQF